jgi:lipopolysaccharide/colanic/teichoic acid biosynthesis glycosyltransferase
VLLGLGALIFFLPVLLGISLLIRIKLGSPVFFIQTRPGQKGKPFNIYKFRTMTNAKGENNTLLPDFLRLTRLGRFLRSTSLDELPELINIVKGDISIVGPRPLLMQYLNRYSLEQARRHDVKPGITGWAQVNGRNAISWDEKFKLDVWYVDHQSLWLDIIIIFMTIKIVFMREGINESGESTMSEFMGNGQVK